MSYPTVLGPWFVVQRLSYGEPSDVPTHMEYYTHGDEGLKMFQSSKKNAMLFMSLASAARVAASEGAEVRALSTKEEADEFGRG